MFWFTLRSNLREHEMDSFYMKYELEDVIQHSSGLSSHLIRLMVVQRKTPRNSRTVGTESRNRCFTVQICYYWALIPPNIDIATELLPGQNSLTCVPLQMRDGVFSGKALFYTYCVTEKGIVTFGCVYADPVCFFNFCVPQYFFHLLFPQTLTLHFTSVCLSSLHDIL